MDLERREGEHPLLHIDEALVYVGYSLDIYREILESFISGGETNRETLRYALETEDYETYRIRTHALKGVAKTIGATTLFEMALAQETAGKVGNTDFIKENHEAFEQCCLEVEAQAKEYLEEEKKKTGMREEEMLVLKEIPADMLKEIKQKMIQSCEEYDLDALEEILQKTDGYALNGKPIREVFENGIILARDFEYEKAVQEFL